jgi:Tfp pilus assembly protein PilX
MPPSFMNAPAHYFHAGFFLITVANMLVILAMIAVFALAILLPYPGSRARRTRR